MSAEENRAIVLRMAEVASTEAVLPLFDPACRFPDLIAYGLPPTLEGLQQFGAMGDAAFSDFKNTVETIVAEGDTVMAWLTQQSTHTGTWRNISATNKRVSYRVVLSCHFAHGKIDEYRVLYDALGWFQQIGAFPSLG
jgi:predicted ester cyclase